MSWWIALCFAVWTPAHAAPRLVTASVPTPVYEFADAEAGVLRVLPRGTKFWCFTDGDEFTRIKVKWAGEWIEGYVLTREIEGTPAPAPADSPAPRVFGLGPAGALSYLRQDGKSFQTDDGVTYKISDYVSQTVWPLAVIQLFRANFWRLRLGFRSTRFKGQAQTDVTGAAPQPVVIQHKMLNVALERVWSPEFARGGYLGLALEFDRASSMTITLGGNDLATSREDLPAYIGGGLLLGYQGQIVDRLTYFGELRAALFPNQSPSVDGLELAAGLLFWP